MTAVRIYDSDHVKVAELENAFKVGYDLYIDRLWTAKFSLPFDDDKRTHCELMNYAEIYDGQKRVGLFRIIKEEAKHDKRGKTITYKCEHVLGSLNGDVIPGIISRTGIANALGYILSQQSVVNWQLGTNDLSGNYEYRWENRSLLYALLDIPTQQKADYQFTFDTTTYPWTVNLVTPSSTPQANVDYGRNLKLIKRTRDIGELVTRLYAYGFGLPGTAEEITIETVNPTGEKYIESNTGTYGVISKTWKDQRFTDPTMLYNAAVELLAQLDTPKTSYTIDAADIYQLIGVDELNLGDYIQITDSELSIDVQHRLVRLRKDDITKSPGGDTFMVLAHKERRLSYGDAAYANDLDGIIGGSGYKPVVIAIEKGYVKNLWSPVDRYPNIYIGTETRGDQNTPRVAITDQQGDTVARTALLKSGYLSLVHMDGSGAITGHILLEAKGHSPGSALGGLSPANPLVMTNIALKELTAAPTSPYDGMLVYADGTSWNPGAGEGAYVYYGGAWHFQQLEAHKATHQDVGGDEINVGGLSGLLADDQHVLDAEAVAAAKTVKLDDLTAPDDNTDLDATTDKHGLFPKLDHDKLDGIAATADVTGDNPPQAHDLDSHNACTLAELSADISDATLIKSTDARLSDSRDPNAHKNSHDPIDGSDKLDTAIPIKVGAANAIGSSHSLSRADHVHEREHAKYTDLEAVAAAKTVKLDDFTTPDDNTNLDATTVKHGLFPKLDHDKLDGIAASADVTGDNPPQAHDLDSHNACTLAELSADISDATLIKSTDARLSDSRTPTAHDLDSHNACTLAELSADISDATLITGHFEVMAGTVFSGAAPLAWSALNLSGTVGSNCALVHLRVHLTAGYATSYAFSPVNNDIYLPANFADTKGCNVLRLEGPNAGYVTVMTNSSGVVYWKANDTQATNIYLDGWIH